MKILVFAFLLILNTFPLFAQINTKATEAVITFGFRNNGKESRGEQRMFIKDDMVRLAGQGNQTEKQYLQNAQKASYQMQTSNGNTYTLKKHFSEYIKAELIPGIDTILGIPCKKAKAIIRSNTVEIWYTDD